ncbi:hypothetical protein EJ06DRAFT_176953 [Trichodelitschia bisporula]|uniref:Uncharacterized protein n=1 Tax=Trichodelitschia bisporula TaxID=703511 RepID=A0A6G1HM16_9PEZI|nr:hypothetical protein EJ06DRAFT_176953 [Trichodelitschia bisporula]
MEPLRASGCSPPTVINHCETIFINRRCTYALFVYRLSSLLAQLVRLNCQQRMNPCSSSPCPYHHCPHPLDAAPKDSRECNRPLGHPTNRAPPASYFREYSRRAWRRRGRPASRNSRDDRQRRCLREPPLVAELEVSLTLRLDACNLPQHFRKRQISPSSLRLYIPIPAMESLPPCPGSSNISCHLLTHLLSASGRGAKLPRSTLECAKCMLLRNGFDRWLQRERLNHAHSTAAPLW